MHIVDYTLFPNESDSVGRMRDVVDAIGRLRDDLVLENIVTGAPREIGIVHNVLPSTDWCAIYLTSISTRKELNDGQFQEHPLSQSIRR